MQPTARRSVVVVLLALQMVELARQAQQGIAPVPELVAEAVVVRIAARAAQAVQALNLEVAVEVAVAARLLVALEALAVLVKRGLYHGKHELCYCKG